MKLYAVVALILLLGCQKNNTRFFEDGEDRGLSIFSNTGNNLLSCYVDNEPWFTRSRISGAATRIDYEIEMFKQRNNTLRDTLQITWLGPSQSNGNTKKLVLRIAVDSNFTSKDFKSLFNNKRIIVDSTINGYFLTNLNTAFNFGTLSPTKGNGVIIFQLAGKNLESNLLTENIIAGLLTAKIGTTEITAGRFDHDLRNILFDF